MGEQRTGKAMATKRTRTGRKAATAEQVQLSAAPARQKTARRAARGTGKAGSTRRQATPARSVQAGRALVVVESPAKAKTIKKYLGSGYIVKASIGHVKDLLKNKLSVDLEHDFAPHYEIIRGKSKVIKEIKEAARGVEAIYLAPDPDREGEAIAWHIAEELGKRHAHHTHRISFNEITKRAVAEALQHPRPLDQHLFASQQARRILDRIVGYQISPILWDKVRMGLSAGRVQSVAVRLVVEREREIARFVADEYWTIECKLQAGAASFTAKVVKQRGEKFAASFAAPAQSAAAALRRAAFVVEAVARRERRRRPVPPLITSKLQQEAFNRLRFTAKRTMMLAQQLYEGVELGAEGSVALITYMRTDSTRVSNDAIAAVRGFIGNTYGGDFLPEQPHHYKTKQSAQDAHEAIRPTSMEYPPERVRPFLSEEQYRLYTLIWRVFVASQMMPAVFDQTTVDIAAGEFALRSTGSVLKFPGFLAVYGQDGAAPGGETRGESDEDGASALRSGGDDDGLAEEGALLPPLQEGEALRCQSVAPEQHFTQPPARFSESTLVKELEEKGIGRPSTYAAILSTIVARGYVQKVEGRFRPSELGVLVTDLLTVSFPRILDVAFTAHMEEQLDQVETGKVDWVKLLHDFYFGDFKNSLEKAKHEMRDVKREEVATEHVCGECGEPLVIKWGRNGSFLACKGYPKCRNTRDYVRGVHGEIEILPEPKSDMACPICQGPMLVKRGRFGQFQACQAYPECKGTRPMSIGVACPNGCGGYIAERRSKRGRIFFGCSKYPECTFSSWNRPLAGPCPLCGAKYLIRKVSKKEGVTIRCPQKGCNYQRDPELDDADAKAVGPVDD